MPDEPETQAPVIIAKPAAGTARTVWRSLFLVAIGGIGAVLGFVTGSDYGDVFAPTFRFVGLEGHVATRTLGALTCAVVASTLTFLGLLVFRRRPRAILLAATPKETKQGLTKKLWPKERILTALKAVEKQRAAGLLSDAAYKKRKAMLESRRAGTYAPRSLSVTDPPLNFIQNGGFEKVNRNSARNRSRWLWWGGWSWGGQYENSWEDRPKYVHSGKYSARIRCTGGKGRIGISTPALPAAAGATEYKLTYWAFGEGDNMLFVNFEAGARGTVRHKIPPGWKEYTLVGKLTPGAKTYSIYFYHIGAGTIWLDDVKVVPVGGKAD